MTGAEHYAKAEELLKIVNAADVRWDANMLAEAQVHATLALAQATLAVTEMADWDSPEPVQVPVENLAPEPRYL